MKVHIHSQFCRRIQTYCEWDVAEKVKRIGRDLSDAIVQIAGSSVV